jgi:tetratricopeptide (TPR) repeat protein
MPKSALPWYNRATMRLKQGDRSGALADYAQALKLDPKDPSIWYGRAQARADSGDNKGAIEDLAEALRVAPADWGKRADALSRQRALRSAVAGGAHTGA